MSDFNLIMVSAFHEAGGNTFHRFLDSHPQLMVYPFESTMGTTLSSNLIAGPNHWMPQRYAYPEFASEWSPEECYHAMADHELKPYLRARQMSKFKDCGLEMDEKKRMDFFYSNLHVIRYRRLNLRPTYRNRQTEDYNLCLDSGYNTRAEYIESLFWATFVAWTNFARTDRGTTYVGYIPPINMDANRFFDDFPNGKMVHVVRNPWSGYADTIKRPHPFPRSRYTQMWNVVNGYARICERKWPRQFFTVRYEDLIADPKSVMNELCGSLGLEPFAATPAPSFNRVPLPNGQVFPWGTIKTPTTEANIATAKELTYKQIEQIHVECGPMIKEWGYEEFYEKDIYKLIH